MPAKDQLQHSTTALKVCLWTTLSYPPVQVTVLQDGTSILLAMDVQLVSLNSMHTVYMVAFFIHAVREDYTSPEIIARSNDFTTVAIVTPIMFILGAFCAIIPGCLIYFCYYKLLKRRVPRTAAASNPVTYTNARPNNKNLYNEITPREATDSAPSSAQLELKENVAYGQF